MFVLRVGWNNMSVAELKALLAPKSVVEEVKRKKEVHPIFQYLAELMKEKIIYYCLSANGKATIHIYSYFDPCPADGDPEKYVPWIHVSVESYGSRIEKLEEQFNFNYPKDNKWFTKMAGCQGVSHRHSRARTPTDNGHIERFIRTLQDECLHRISRDIKIWKKEIPDFLHYYNTERPHMGINYQTPIDIIKWSEGID